MNNPTNCHNCGASLKYNEKNYGSTAKCEYCNTEYHIDKLGRIEEYKVKLMMYGKIVTFYVYSMQAEYPCIETTSLQDNARTYIYPAGPELTLELHSIDFEDIEK